MGCCPSKMFQMLHSRWAGRQNTDCVDFNSMLHVDGRKTVLQIRRRSLNSVAHSLCSSRTTAERSQLVLTV